MDAPQNGDPLSFFTPGQRFVPSAQTLNAWQAAARAVAGGVGISGPSPAWSNALKVKAKNNHTSNMERGQVLQVGGPQIDPTSFGHVVREAPYINGAKPTADFSPCVVAAEPIPTGATGWAYLFGCCWAKVNFAANGDRYAYCKNDEPSYLKSHPVCGNARVIWPTSGTGTRDALVLLHNDPRALFPATLKSNWTSGSTATINAVGDTATDITATGWGCAYPMDAGAKVLAFLHGSTFYFFPMAETTDDVFTAVELDTDNNKLQFKVRTLRGSFASAETTGAYVLTTDCE